MRVASACCFLLGSVSFVLAGAFLPTYILTSAQIGEYEARIASEGDTTILFAEAENEVNTTNTLLAQLRTSSHRIPASHILEEIHSVAPEGITFMTFQLQGVGQVPELVQVQGKATTRDVLIRFKKALEASTLVQSVEIPIGDLARDANLPFAVSIMLKDISL